MLVFCVANVTCETNAVCSKQEGHEVGQASDDCSEGDGDVVCSVLLWNFLPIKVAVDQATDLEQQIADDPCLEGTPAKAMPSQACQASGLANLHGYYLSQGQTTFGLLTALHFLLLLLLWTEAR